MPKKARSEKKEKTARDRRVNQRLLIFALACCAGGMVVFSRTIVRSASTTLSVQNQKLEEDLAARSAAIEQLKGEISQLQEKSRVLGMLDGQVTDDQDNVYYYDSQ